MTEKSGVIITKAINDLRAQKLNDVEIALDMLAGAVVVLIDASGTDGAADFLVKMADQVKQHGDLRIVN